jgi:hypothetical protein
MIIAPQEKRSQGPLIAFIDLLFLLVAFFTLLLFFIQQSRVVSEQKLAVVQKSLSRIIGQEVDVPQAVKRLEPLLERFMAREEQQAEQRKQEAAREERRKQRTTFRLVYTLLPAGKVIYEGRTLDLAAFKSEVLDPLRRTHWVALRAYADPQTPFGLVVESRAILLQDSNEFDTYWDNVTRGKTPARPEGN